LPHPTPPAAGDPRRQRDGRNPRDGREPGSTRGGVDPYPYPAPALVPFRRAWFPAAAVLVVLTLIAVSAVTGRPVVFGAWPLVWLAFFVARRGRHYPHRLAVRRHGGRPC
ncbi:MAG TPA: hypothetical protein VGN54_02520, partial [Mycobacteriales bacterium]|nr:hypothetical protein [Mycobacteriales bacterium]